MATKDKVRRMLDVFERNYGKRSGWAEEMTPAWSYALKTYSDDDVSRVGREIMSKKARLPSVASFLETLKGNPLTAKPEGLSGCPACSGTGWREVAWHRWQGDRLAVTTYAAGCDCSKGRRLSSGQVVQDYRDIVQRFTDDPTTQEVYYTNSQHPLLTTEERYAPEMVERMRKKTGHEPGVRPM
jgi:hypothetical protein